MELNARTAPQGMTLDAEVCIVGAGPAGITLAHALQSRGIQCALIESGGYPPEAESQELNLAEASGDFHQDLRLARARGAGGTAALWNTWFRGAPFAKYLPLDPIDFDARAWIPWSGWPFGRSALESYYHRARAVCGLGSSDFDGTTWSEVTAPLLGQASGGLLQSVYQYGPADRFTAALPAELAGSAAVTWLHGATVTGLETAASGDRIVAARWSSLSGIEGRVRADRFVLAAGAIENARLLLAHASGVDDGDGWLGRGFMEHPVDASLELSSRDPALAATPGFFGAREAGGGIVVGRIGMSEDLLRFENLPNASLRLFRETEPVLMRSPGFRSVARRLVPFRALRRRIGDAIRRRSSRTPPGGTTRHRVLLDLEQPPHRENRIRLSDQRDPLGQPRAVLEWRWWTGDEAGRRRVREVFARELERAGAGKLLVSRETPLDSAIHHHAGTTRMHPDPALGVVDSQVAVHHSQSGVNVAGLLLARATARAREMAVRAALGASRTRLVRQMLVESLLLAAAGTVAGAAGALALLKLAIATLPASVPRLAQTSIDLRLLGFALAVVAGTALLFGLIPALVAASTQASESLKDSTRTSTGVRGRRLSGMLVVAEVALACAVLVASALLVRSVNRMMHAPTGVEGAGVVTATLQLESKAYPDWVKVEQFYSALLDGVRRQPGIEAAGVANAITLETGWRVPFLVDGRPAPRPEDLPIAQHVTAGDGYFETFRVRLLKGRIFTPADTAGAEGVVVVNETFARRIFPGEDPVGKRIISQAQQIGPLGRNLKFTSREVRRVPFQIVGVVGDVQHAPIGQAEEPVIYHTPRQFPFRAMTIVARGSDTASTVSGLRSALRAMDPSLPLSNVRTMDERMVTATAAPRLLTAVLTTFAALTGLLAAIGVYGLLAWTVNERRRELAIRLALGAQPAALARLVTRHGLTLALIGVALGLAGAQLARGVLRAVLFQTNTTDVAAMAAAAGLLLTAATLACLAPARRAARVAPAEGLRD